MEPGPENSNTSNSTVPKRIRCACSECRLMHKACDRSRPCSRCVANGVADKCCDPADDPRILAQSLRAKDTSTASIHFVTRNGKKAKINVPFSPDTMFMPYGFFPGFPFCPTGAGSYPLPASAVCPLPFGYPDTMGPPSGSVPPTPDQYRMMPTAASPRYMDGSYPSYGGQIPHPALNSAPPVMPTPAHPHLSRTTSSPSSADFPYPATPSISSSGRILPGAASTQQQQQQQQQPSNLSNLLSSSGWSNPASSGLPQSSVFGGVTSPILNSTEDESAPSKHLDTMALQATSKLRLPPFSHPSMPSISSLTDEMPSSNLSAMDYSFEGLTSIWTENNEHSSHVAHSIPLSAMTSTTTENSAHLKMDGGLRVSASTALQVGHEDKTLDDGEPAWFLSPTIVGKNAPGHEPLAEVNEAAWYLNSEHIMPHPPITATSTTSSKPAETDSSPPTPANSASPSAPIAPRPTIDDVLKTEALETNKSQPIASGVFGSKKRRMDTDRCRCGQDDFSAANIIQLFGSLSDLHFNFATSALLLQPIRSDDTIFSTPNLSYLNQGPKDQPTQLCDVFAEPDLDILLGDGLTDTKVPRVVHNNIAITTVDGRPARVTVVLTEDFRLYLLSPSF